MVGSFPVYDLSAIPSPRPVLDTRRANLAVAASSEVSRCSGVRLS